MTGPHRIGGVLAAVALCLQSCSKPTQTAVVGEPKGSSPATTAADPKPATAPTPPTPQTAAATSESAPATSNPLPVPTSRVARPEVTTPAPSASALRAEAIRRTAVALAAECQSAAGGDWVRWERALDPYRKALAARIAAAKPVDPNAAAFEARSPVLSATDDFPLVECGPQYYLRYLLDPTAVNLFRRDRPVEAGVRWLKARGIDVLFVPVPKMTEVYPQHFADGCPADRIVAPQVRKVYADLLAADVEVVDLLPTFQADKGGYLYQPADPHWSPYAQALAAKVVAARLARYDFVAKARAGSLVTETAELPYQAFRDAIGFPALTPSQRQRAEPAQPKSWLAVRRPKGPDIVSVPASPVMMIGNSYNNGFRDLLANELNMYLHYADGGGQTTELFKDLVRDPSLLQHCKVVVWTVTGNDLGAFVSMPGPVRETLKP